MSPPVAAEIFGKMRAMEHHASPPSSLIWLWLLVSFGEPLVTFLTALFEGCSDSIVMAYTVNDIHRDQFLLSQLERIITLISLCG